MTETVNLKPGNERMVPVRNRPTHIYGTEQQNHREQSKGKKLNLISMFRNRTDQENEEKNKRENSKNLQH